MKWLRNAMLSGSAVTACRNAAMTECSTTAVLSPVCGRLPEKQVRRALTGDGARAFVAECPQVDPLKQVLARPQEHRLHGEVELVDQPLPQILPDRLHAAADPNVAGAGRRARAIERGMDAVRDED